LKVATEDDIDSWLKEMELDSLSKTALGNWSFLRQSEDSTIQISVMFSATESESAPTIGVGCQFLDPPERNQCELYKRLLELHTISQETKFCVVTNGAIMLITHRSAVDLDPSELNEMVNNVVDMYFKFHDDCMSIVI
jgi:hypothetical protein